MPSSVTLPLDITRRTLEHHNIIIGSLYIVSCFNEVVINDFVFDLLSHVQLDTFPASWTNDFHYKLYPIQYPSYLDVDDWQKLFRPCATQRIFLPVSLNPLSYVKKTKASL